MTLKDNGDESILQEAQRLTHGDRNKDYGHPLDDYTRTAALINALLAHKLKAPLDAEDAAQIQILVKLSRHQTARKRDNMTDAAGYAWVSWACTEERERRNPTPVNQYLQQGALTVTPANQLQAGVDQGTYCAVNSWRLAPVIGCECSTCSRKRKAAATGV